MIMMFDQDKAIHSLLYIFEKCNRETMTYHELFKTLYFAEMDHLTKYGKTISGDKYIAMQWGPVPSKIYDELKPNFLAFVRKKLHKYFEVKKPKVQALVPFDPEELSISEIECLDIAIEEIKGLDFKERSAKSHGFAWTNTKTNQPISQIDMAKEKEADEEMIAYINNSIENEKVF